MKIIFLSWLALYLIPLGQYKSTQPTYTTEPTQPAYTPEPARSTYTFEVVDSKGKPLTGVVDGNVVRLRLTVNEPVRQAQNVFFTLEPQGKKLGECIIPANGSSCLSDAVSSLNWFWLTKTSYLKASTRQGNSLLNPIVKPRPVVLVHGFNSSASAWDLYLRENGFLDNAGLKGFAVGDGQANGLMNTGDFLLPTLQTKTIAENALELASYISGVKTLTGAEKVDLVVHSMGGLISRYYIDELMQEVDVAQLIMLGTPHGGSNCSNLPVQLGFYLPAALELRPVYLTNVFNQEITDRRGVPFFQIAGTPIKEAFKAPCTEVPTDLAVSLASINTLPTSFTEAPVLHTALTSSEEAFTGFVLERLKNVEPKQSLANLPEISAGLPSQATQIFSGHVNPGEVKNIDVHLDEVTIASFALFDPSRSLEVTVRGANGKIIELSPDQHGLITINDPTTLVHIGYGFSNPKAGPWKVTLTATDSTPPEGADYALSAYVVGGAHLTASALPLLPKLGQKVDLKGTLELDKTLWDINITALIHKPDGSSENILLRGNNNAKSITWLPKQLGLHGVDIVAKAVTADNLVIERTNFLAVDVQPKVNLAVQRTLWVSAGVLFLIALSLIIPLPRQGKHA